MPMLLILVGVTTILTTWIRNYYLYTEQYKH